MQKRLYKYSESLIKKYLTITQGKNTRYAFSYWPYISLKNNSSETEVLFKGKKIFSASSFDSLRPTNEDIYILASGPSIKKQDLTLLRHKQVITLNGSISAAKEAGFIPFFHFIMDANFILKRPDLALLVPPETPIALSLSAVKAAAIFTPEILKKHPICLAKNPLEIYPFPRLSVEELDEVNFAKNSSNTSAFSLNPEKGFFDGGSVLTLALQLAYYCKFKRVFLLGFDIGNAEEPRFYETTKNRLSCGLLNDYESKILPFMRLAAALYKQAGREIYNCSAITKLPYEIVPFFDFSKEI